MSAELISHFTGRRFSMFAGAGAAALLLAACGQEVDDLATAAPPAGDDAVRMDVAVDGGFITLDGTVLSTAPDTFVLDYGDGEVTVEMDDWDWYREGQALVPGDEVAVTGRFDQDLYEQAKVEASIVYVEDLQTAYYANPADEEALGASAGVTIYPRNVDVTGRVAAVDGTTFTLEAPSGAFRVDVSNLAENPLDNEGERRIEAGDRVYAWGDLQLAGLDSRLMAEGVVSLSTDDGTANAAAQTPAAETGDSAQSG